LVAALGWAQELAQLLAQELVFELVEAWEWPLALVRVQLSVGVLAWALAVLWAAELVVESVEQWASEWVLVWASG